jgi:phosphoglycerate dehydrogenase-like enzyme
MGTMPEDTVHVLFAFPFPQEMIERLQGISPRLAIQVLPVKTVEEIPEETWAEVEVLYTIGVLPPPETAPKLKWVQLHYAGADHVLGHPLLDSEVTFTTMSGASVPQMAEFALLGLLAMGRKLYSVLADNPEVRWSGDRYTRFQPQDLRGSTVGIIGYGSIGREVGRLCYALGMEVLASKQDLMKLEDEGYQIEGLGDPGADIPNRLYPPQAVRSMAELCDFVVVTVPLTDDTRGLVNAAVLEAMRPSAYLIDVSRGGVVDQEALLAALNTKQLAGAWLDVFEEEPLPDDHPFWGMDNVIVTPHIAGASSRYLERATDLMAANLQRYLAEQPLINRLDHKRGY